MSIPGELELKSNTYKHVSIPQFPFMEFSIVIANFLSFCTTKSSANKKMTETELILKLA